MIKLTIDQIKYNKGMSTIAQFKCLQYVKDNFVVEAINLYLYDDNTIMIIDRDNAIAFVQYSKDKGSCINLVDLNTLNLDKLELFDEG